jgi:hypothetical protein
MWGHNTQIWVTTASLLGLSLGFALKSSSDTISKCPPAQWQPRHIFSCRPEEIGNGTDYFCDGDQVLIWQQTPVGLPKDMTSLRINNTKLVNLPMCSFAGLEIETLIIEANQQLTSLDLKVFVDLDGVQNLVIRDNPILNIDPLFRTLAPLFELKRLYLEDNLIQSSTSTTTADNESIGPNLEYISLKGNPLVRIDIDFFKPLFQSPLTRLSLEDCSLETIQEGILYTHISTYIIISLARPPCPAALPGRLVPAGSPRR